MKSKLVPVLFVLAAALIAGVFFFSKKVIAIYISNRKAIVIPRHFFETKEQEEKIEKFIKEKYMIENKK